MTQVIKLSDKAADRIKEILSENKDSLGVRIGVKSGGCAGMSYIMEYAKTQQPNDELIEDKGVKVFIDPSAIMYLLGTEMDYKVEEFSSSFVFNNPNETERCGCGESFKIYSINSCNTSQIQLDVEYVQNYELLPSSMKCMHQSGRL